MNNTTRKHPRTLAEAFPKTTDYACAVTKPARGIDPLIGWFSLAAGVAGAIILIVWG